MTSDYIMKIILQSYVVLKVDHHTFAFILGAKSSSVRIHDRFRISVTRVEEDKYIIISWRMRNSQQRLYQRHTPHFIKDERYIRAVMAACAMVEMEGVER